MAEMDKKEAEQLSHRDRYRTRYQKMYPELNIDDEESFYETANANIDELEGYRKNNMDLVDTFNRNKAFASMLMAAKEGQDPFEWMAANIGADISELLNDPEYAKKISEATKKFNDSQAQGEVTKKEYEENVQKSLQSLQEIQQETGWSNEQCYDLASAVYDIISDGLQGIIKPDTYRLVMNGQNFQTAVDEARQEGEVTGRNAKISEKLKKAETTNGIPPSLPTSKGDMIQKNNKKKSFWDDAK